MFSWFKKNKTIKILVVVNGDSHEPIDYKNKVDVDINTEIRAACNELAIEYDDGMINDISKKLEAGETYWHPDNYGFEVIDIEL